MTNTVTIVIVPEAACPTCGGGDEWFNRPKVADAAGVWWWRCYNPVCSTRYYDPTVSTDLTPVAHSDTL